MFRFGASLELRARLHAFDYVHVRRRCALTRGAQALRTCSAHICAEGTQQKTRARAHKFWYTQQKRVHARTSLGISAAGAWSAARAQPLGGIKGGFLFFNYYYLINIIKRLLNAYFLFWSIMKDRMRTSLREARHFRTCDLWATASAADPPCIVSTISNQIMSLLLFVSLSPWSIC